MKKRFVPVCFALCLLITVAFAVSTVSSRRALPAGLYDMYGDTAGIRSLSIEGLVADTNHKYAYTFAINPQRTSTTMHVHKSRGDVSRDLGINYSFVHPSAAIYIPDGETKSEVTESESSFYDTNGQWSPLEEYRIYAARFEVVPVLNASNVPIAIDPAKGRLYISPEENPYIAIVEHNPAYDYQLQAYNPGFSIDRSVRLHGELAVGDKRFVVITGRGYYGHTALYVVDAPGGHIPTVQAAGDNQVYIVADECYPITLAHGDEILGLIGLNNGILLAIQRERGFELIRIDAETRENTVVYTEGKAWFDNYHLTDDSLVLVSTGYSDDSYPDIHVFDLANDGLSHVMSVQSANLWANRSDGIYYDIAAAIWKNGTLYAAANTGSAMGGSSPGEVQITALARSGAIIGRCKLLCGIEEDYTMFWTRNIGSVQSAYVRVLRSISLQ